MSWIDDDGLSDQRGSGMPKPLQLAQHLGVAALDTAIQAPQRGHCRRAERSVRDQADLALELADAAGGPGAVDAVRATDVVAHLVQSFLKRAHVIADYRLGDRHVQRAIAELPPGGVECSPGLLAYPPIHVETTALLELAHGRIGGPIELRVGTARG